MKSSYLQAVYLPHTVVRVCMCIPCLQGKYPSYSTTVRMHSQIRQLWLIQTVLLCIRLNKSHGYKTSSLKVTHNKYLRIVPGIIQNLFMKKKKEDFFSSSTINNVCTILILITSPKGWINLLHLWHHFSFKHHLLLWPSTHKEENKIYTPFKLYSAYSGIGVI